MIVNNPESGIVPNSLLHLLSVGIALRNKEKENDVVQLGLLYMANKQKLPLRVAGAGGTRENGSVGQSVFFPEERNGLFQRRKRVGNADVTGKIQFGAVVIIEPFEGRSIGVKENKAV